jgi:hypothetical protein
MYSEANRGITFLYAPAASAPPADRTSLEHFSCCWVFREGLAVAFSLGKTPINIKPLRYTHRGNALVTHDAKKLDLAADQKVAGDSTRKVEKDA